MNFWRDIYKQPMVETDFIWSPSIPASNKFCLKISQGKSNGGGREFPMVMGPILSIMITLTYTTQYLFDPDIYQINIQRM
ncbi:hypothetical protein HZS_5514 [Henneguya salminicola]|nr:hypothetical protein HZS_5514 [Henneguya salminicola]